LDWKKRCRRAEVDGVHGIAEVLGCTDSIAHPIQPSGQPGVKQEVPTDACRGASCACTGQWERWHDPSEPIVESCSLITTEANELMRPIHNRMPVILDPDREDEWLNPRSEPDSLRALLVPFASARMEAFPVNPYVSNAKNEGVRCIEPAVA
jgi:putative SOS response-associated peptidase YedK